MPLFQTAPFPNAPLEAWKAPTLLNGWSNYGSSLSIAGYWKDPFGIVHLRGVLAGGTLNQKLFTLPEGYRPAYLMIFAVSTQDISLGSLPGRCDVNTNGDVSMMIGAQFYFSLDGISFRSA